jgi:hypothetical protein
MVTTGIKTLIEEDVKGTRTMIMQVATRKQKSEK